MVNPEQEKKVIDELRQIANGIVGYDVEDLIRATDLGRELNFESARPLFVKTLHYARTITEINLSLAPFDVVNTLRGQLKRIWEVFQKIKDFSPNKVDNARSQREAIVNELERAYQDTAGSAGVISLLMVTKQERQSDQTRISGIIADLEGKKSEFEEKRTQLVSEIEAVLEQVREAAGQVGVSRHATLFAEEANQHNRRSIWWLIATGVFVILTILWGWESIRLLPDLPKGANGEIPNLVLVQFAVSKLIILSALYYLVILCAKNFGAHRHNFVVNRHRQNALSTFEAFVSAAEKDPDTKHAVLLQAASSIFSAQATGYGAKESDSDPLRLIEILRTGSQRAQS